MFQLFMNLVKPQRDYIIEIKIKVNQFIIKQNCTTLTTAMGTVIIL